MKKNCICLSCKNLDYEYIKDGEVKCSYQVDSDEPIGGALLLGETAKCPIGLYEKEDNNTSVFDENPPIPYYAGSVPKRKPSYRCSGCVHYVDHSCSAFPEGIPSLIIANYGHKNKLPGQNTDLVFEWKEEND